MSQVTVEAALDERDVRLDICAPAGSVTAVVGPNAAGKTTLLHLVAGLLRPTSGSVRVGDRTLSDARRVVPTHRRRVALLTQRSSLFPHLTVLENVAFAPRATGASRATARDRALKELEAAGCANLASRRAHELSGGQAQRVAIARALAGDPLVVLLDEPMAGLDVAVAAEVRHVLAERLRGRTALFVTHEVLDLWTIADRVAVVDGGRIVEAGAVDDVLLRPTSTFLAQLSGLTLLSGVERDGDLEIAPGVLLQGLRDPGQPLTHGSRGLAGIPPDAVVRVRLEVASQQLAADVTTQSVAGLGLHPGQAIWAVVKAVQVRLYGR